MTPSRRAELRQLAADVLAVFSAGPQVTLARAVLDELDESDITDGLLRQADNAAHALAKVLGRKYDRQTNFGEAVTDLKEMVAEVAKLAWVSVAERLPENKGVPVVWLYDGRIPAALGNGNLEWAERHRYTHWMELPSPPGPAGKGTT